VAKLFWAQTKLATGVKNRQLNEATWAADLISELCPRRDQAIIMCGMWALWMMQNKRRHGELTMTIHQAVIWARDTAHDMWQLGHQSGHQTAAQDPPRRKKPEPGCLKINTDAAFF
jgi:hypothetical protein